MINTKILINAIFYKSPHLLTTLNTTYNTIDPVGLEYLKESPRLKQLEFFKADFIPEEFD